MTAPALESYVVVLELPIWANSEEEAAEKAWEIARSVSDGARVVRVES